MIELDGYTQTQPDWFLSETRSTLSGKQLPQ